MTIADGLRNLTQLSNSLSLASYSDTPFLSARHILAESTKNVATALEPVLVGLAEHLRHEQKLEFYRQVYLLIGSRFLSQKLRVRAATEFMHGIRFHELIVPWNKAQYNNFYQFLLELLDRPEVDPQTAALSKDRQRLLFALIAAHHKPAWHLSPEHRNDITARLFSFVDDERIDIHTRVRSMIRLIEKMTLCHTQEASAGSAFLDNQGRETFTHAYLKLLPPTS